MAPSPVVAITTCSRSARGCHRRIRETAPENYLQIYNGDFVYAAAHATSVPVQAGITTVSTTFPNILNLGSQQLLAISESPLIAPNTWVEIKG